MERAVAISPANKANQKQSIKYEHGQIMRHLAPGHTHIKSPHLFVYRGTLRLKETQCLYKVVLCHFAVALCLSVVTVCLFVVVLCNFWLFCFFSW